MQISELLIETIKIEPTKNIAGYLVVSLDGITGLDLLACMDDNLLHQLMDAIGEDSFREHFGLDYESN